MPQFMHVPFLPSITGNDVCFSLLCIRALSTIFLFVWLRHTKRLIWFHRSLSLSYLARDIPFFLFSFGLETNRKVEEMESKPLHIKFEDREVEPLVLYIEETEWVSAAQVATRLMRWNLSSLRRELNQRDWDRLLVKDRDILWKLAQHGALFLDTSIPSIRKSHCTEKFARVALYSAA